MAAEKGLNMTKLTTYPVDYPDVGEIGGRVRVFYDTYVAAALALGSTIDIARLPKGARVLPQSRVYFTALGAGTTLAVGVAGDTSRYLAATSSVAAGSAALDVLAGINVELAAESTVIVTTGGGAITGAIKSVILYTLD